MAQTTSLQMEKNKLVTILYAYRNRDAKRVFNSLQSLVSQTNHNFEVLFIDYGSETHFSSSVKKVIDNFHFANYYYVGHPGLLWNKSKALNFGIKRAKTEFIFIADVDLLFHQNTIQLFRDIATIDKAFIFKLSYLDEKCTKNIDMLFNFKELNIKHTGNVNGMVLVSRQALFKVQGLDEFFHFYGSEDVDLFQRLEKSGQTLQLRDELYFKHQWHVIYNSYNDKLFSKEPRLYNIKRINQEHYFYNKSSNYTVPVNNPTWGEIIDKKNYDLLHEPTQVYKLPNIHALIWHFIEIKLPNMKNEVVKVSVYEDNYFQSFKYRLKKIMNKQTQPYITLKEVNDLLLNKIIYTYKNYNYSYKIDDDLKQITFTIELK